MARFFAPSNSLFNAALMLLVSAAANIVESRGLAQETVISEQERLRGSITKERSWWDLKHYELSVQVDPANKFIRGSNRVRFEVVDDVQQMQIDLQPPLAIDSVNMDLQPLAFSRNGNVYLVTMPSGLEKGREYRVDVAYSGNPVESRRPPWSGGFTWRKDSSGKPFIATSCQGDGASLWWPCKDHGYDEPDDGVDLLLTVPNDLSAVGNGRLLSRVEHPASMTTTFHWRVTQPINNYSVNANIGDYVHIADEFDGELGKLDMHYWVLRENREAAIRQFKEAPRTIEAFEDWFGPYPFYEDSYKLVEVPYLGMEH
ncbi:MAG: M1 family peptidase, partial [Planctomycetota bacterium]